MRLGGFRNYDETLQYARTLYQQENITRLLQRARIIIISDKNLELLGKQFSYDDYEKFYEEHFVPLKISTVRLLTEPATIEYEKPPVPEPSGVGDDQDDGLFNGGVLDDNTLIDLGVEPTDAGSSFDIPTDEPSRKPAEPAPADRELVVPTETPARKPDEPAPAERELIVPAETPARKPDVQPEPAGNDIIIPADTPAPKAEEPTIDDGTLIIPEEKPQSNAPALDGDIMDIPAEQPVATPAKPAAPTAKPTVPTPTAPTVAPATTPKAPTATEKPMTTPKKPEAKSATKPVQPNAQKQPERKQEDTGIDFSDGFGSQNKTPQKQPAKKKPVVDLEDEYYDLEGF